jgi:hypothetical protein
LSRRTVAASPKIGSVMTMTAAVVVHFSSLNLKKINQTIRA